MDDLTNKGVPYDVSDQIARGVFRYKSELKGKEGLKGIGCGLLMVIAGAIITGLTYSAASDGGSYVVTTGLFVVGGITFIVGFIRWVTS